MLVIYNVYMNKLQETFDELQKCQSRAKEIKGIYRDALANTPEYQEIQDKMKSLKTRKKQIENSTQESFSKELEELEDLQVDIGSYQEMISDIALTKMVKGETIMVKDQYENEYEPLFKVKFNRAR